MARVLGILGLLVAALAPMARLECAPGAKSTGVSEGPSTPLTESTASPEGECSGALRQSPIERRFPDRTEVRDQNPTERRAPWKSEAPPPPLRIQVLGLDGKPVEGATILVGHRDAEPVAETDPEGRVLLERSRTDTRVCVQAYLGDRATLPRSFSASVHSATLQLVPTEDVRGRVVDAVTGEGIPHAQVRIQQPSGPLLRYVHGESDGFFRFVSLPKGLTLQGTAERPGYTRNRWMFGIEKDPSVTSPELTVRLVPAHDLRGTVVNAITGVPVQGATVSASPTSTIESRATDAAGRFLFDDLVSNGAERLRLWVDAPGFCAIRGTFHGDAAAEAFRIRLIPTARFEVRAVDSEGIILREAWITASQGSTRDPIETPEALSDWVDEGWELTRTVGVGYEPQYSPRGYSPTVECVPYTEIATIRAELRGFEPVRKQLPVAGPPASTRDYALTLTPGLPASASPWIRGTLRVNGQPAPGQVRWSSAGDQDIDVTLGNGAFELHSVTPGTVTLEPFPHLPSAPGLAHYFAEGMPLSDRRVSVDLAPEGGIRVDLDITVPMGVISGRARVRDGEPLVGRTVRIHSIDWPLEPGAPSPLGSLATTRTDALGDFEFQVPAELAPYRVSLIHGGRTLDTRVDEAPSQGVEFSLPPTRPVLLHAFKGGTNELATFFEVHVRPSESEAFRPVELEPDSSAPHGSLVAHDSPVEFELPLGTYDFLVGFPAALPARLDSITLSAGNTPLVLRAEIPETLRADIFLTPDSKPIAEGHTVLLLEERHWDAIQDPNALGMHGAPYPATTPAQARGLHFGPRRRALLASMLPGRYRFKVFPPDITIEPEWIEMGSSDRRVEIRWE